MKNLLIPALLLGGLALGACTAESSKAPAEQATSSTPAAELVSFKIKGMT